VQMFDTAVAVPAARQRARQRDDLKRPSQIHSLEERGCGARWCGVGWWWCEVWCMVWSRECGVKEYGVGLCWSRVG
jgi:hypothetical protein